MATESADRIRVRHGRWRTWLRTHTPSRLYDRGIVIAKVGNCGAHEWYRHDSQTDACYHCLATKQRAQGAQESGARDGLAVAVHEDRDGFAQQRPLRDPMHTLAGCERIVVVGRTGSGKTTFARELAAALRVPHVELDSLYFGPQFSTAPLALLRERTSSAIAGERWVTDGNKRAVRDLVWPRADTIVWLDYSLGVSLWRLGRRARRRTSELRAEASRTGQRGRLPRQLLAAATGVLTALRSHAGQRREYRRLFAEPANEHLAVVRLQSPRAAREWLARVIAEPLSGL